MFQKIYKSMRFVSLFALVISAILVFSTGYYVFNLRVEAEIREQASLLARFADSSLQKDGVLPAELPPFSDGKSYVILSSDGSLLYDADPTGKIASDGRSLLTRPEVANALADGSVVPAGKGIGNVEKIVSEYVAAGGREFTIEPHLTVFSGLSGLEREGDTSVVGTVYRYPSRDAAFDAACGYFRELLERIG